MMYRVVRAYNIIDEVEKWIRSVVLQEIVDEVQPARGVLARAGGSTSNIACRQAGNKKH
jgi:hypothetical protein